MASKERTHIAVNDAAKTDDAVTVRYMTKQQFGRRLHSLMAKRGFHQAELARRAGLTKSSISEYIGGRAFPSQQNARRLAKALGVTEEEVLPNAVRDAVQADQPVFEMKVSDADPSKAWVKIDRWMDFDIAVKIADLIREANAADRA